MTIAPGSNILIVTLPYFYIGRKLTRGDSISAFSGRRSAAARETVASG